MTNFRAILLSEDSKIINSLFSLLNNCGKVKEAKRQGELDFFVALIPNGAGYYGISANCTLEMYEWLNGFCTGYMAGIGFDNDL